MGPMGGDFPFRLPERRGAPGPSAADLGVQRAGPLVVSRGETFGRRRLRARGWGALSPRSENRWPGPGAAGAITRAASKRRRDKKANSNQIFRLRISGIAVYLRGRLRIWRNWQTRYFEVVVGKPVQVQVLLCALYF